MCYLGAAFVLYAILKVQYDFANSKVSKSHLNSFTLS